MKVLLFANTDWYIYNFRIELARSLREAGHSVVIVVPDGQYVQRIRDAGFRVIVLDMSRRGINLVQEVSTLYRLVGIYRKECPDIAHHFTIKAVVYGGLVAKIAGIHAIVHAVAGMGYVFSSRSILAKILKPLLKMMLKWILKCRHSLLILQNRDDVEQFVSMGMLPRQCIRLIRGSGVNIGRFFPVERSGNKEFRVLLATRLLWDKGVREYVEAAKHCHYSEIKFIVAGNTDIGNPASVPAEYLNEQVAAGYIEYVGHVEDMAEIMSTVHAVVLPTVYGEGVPRVLLEAAASGLPIVATDVPGCREIVHNDDNGYLIKPKSWEAVLQAIEKLYRDPTMARQMGLRSREIVVVEYDEKKVIQQTLGVYRELHQDA